MRNKILTGLLGISLAVCIQGAVVTADEAAISAGDTSVEEMSSAIDGTVYEGTLSTGASYFAYIPENENYGNRATSDPILIVYGDSAFTADSAKETVIESGISNLSSASVF